MKIGIDISSATNGKSGVPRYTRSLVENLLALDSENYYELTAYPFEKKKLERGFADLLKKPNVCVRYRQVAFNRIAKNLPDLYPVAAKILPSFFKNLLRKKRSDFGLESQRVLLDIFHSSDGVFFNNKAGKNIVTLHDITTTLFPEFHTKENRLLHDQKIKFAKENADHLIAVSENTKNDLMRHCQIVPEKISVIYNGINHHQFRVLPASEVNQVLRKYKLTPGYLLYVGTIEPRKNIETLVHAFEILTKKMNNFKLPLVIAGPKGWLFQKTLKRIEASVVKNRIRVLGAVTEQDLPFLYNGARVFIYPSFYEGFGFPVLEAMACGVPVIASDTSSLPEVVGDSGQLVPPKDPERFAEAILDLLVNPEKHAFISQKALKRPCDFSWQKTARETLAIYKKIHEQ